MKHPPNNSEPGEQVEPPEYENHPRPRWLLVIGVGLFIIILALAAFSMGVYMTERGLL